MKVSFTFVCLLFLGILKSSKPFPWAKILHFLDLASKFNLRPPSDFCCCPF